MNSYTHYRSESGGYPLGAEHDPRAPWNEQDEQEQEFEVELSYNLQRRMTVRAEDEDDIHDTAEDMSYSPQELLGELAKRLRIEYSTCKSGRIRRMLEACEEWEQIDFDYDIL